MRQSRQIHRSADPAQVLRGFLVLLVWFIVCRAPAAEKTTGNPTHFRGISRFGSFQRATTNGLVVLTSPWFTAPRPWNELVVSWNGQFPPGSHLKVEARAAGFGKESPFYTLGLWSPDTSRHPRESVRGQRDPIAEVKTDTLVCRSHMERCQIRLALAGDSAPPKLKFIGLCTTDTTLSPEPLAANRAAWGRVIEVPRRVQIGYPGADGWCSPTCVSMILAHWSAVLCQPALDIPVPEVARGVHDRNWEGTGNWPFNTAFAGKFDGMRAFVTRLSDVAEIESWVLAGVPVAASVSFDLLNGRSRDEGNGHLIVVVGFTKEGDVVINDPWPDPKGVNSVRKTFPRQNLIRAWDRSKRTVYLIHPETMRLPTSALKHW